MIVYTKFQIPDNIYHLAIYEQYWDLCRFELGFNKIKTTFFHICSVFNSDTSSDLRNVVPKWKSKLSAFQKIKYHWNRLIIHEDMLNFVLESIIIACERVYPVWWGLMTVMRPHHTGYTRSHAIIIDSNTKIKISSRIINRFQWFLMFWKAESLLFRVETTLLGEL